MEKVEQQFEKLALKALGKAKLGCSPLNETDLGKIIEWLAWYKGSPSTEVLRRELDFVTPIKDVLGEEEAPSSICNPRGWKVNTEARPAVGKTEPPRKPECVVDDQVSASEGQRKSSEVSETKAHYEAVEQGNGTKSEKEELELNNQESIDVEVSGEIEEQGAVVTSVRVATKVSNVEQISDFDSLQTLDGSDVDDVAPTKLYEDMRFRLEEMNAVTGNAHKVVDELPKPNKQGNAARESSLGYTREEESVEKGPGVVDQAQKGISQGNAAVKKAVECKSGHALNLLDEMPLQSPKNKIVSTSVARSKGLGKDAESENLELSGVTGDAHKLPQAPTQG
ncbi:hypothetical protein U1Q18_028344, partial [Sarracenia purpurea var. burkii]